MGGALFVAGSLALAALVCANAYLAADLVRRGGELPNVLLHPVEVAGRLGFVGACALLAWASGLPARQFGLGAGSPFEDILLGVVAAVLLQQANHAGSRWAARRFGPRVYAPAFLRATLPKSRRQWVLAPLVLLPAALAEEALFRGLLVGGLSAYVSPWLLAVVFSLVFGLAHLPQGRLGVLGASALGLCLSLLFLWRWSIVACTVAHYGVNLAQLVRAEEELRWFEGG